MKLLKFALLFAVLCVAVFVPTATACPPGAGICGVGAVPAQAPLYAPAAGVCGAGAAFSPGFAPGAYYAPRAAFAPTFAPTYYGAFSRGFGVTSFGAPVGGGGFFQQTTVRRGLLGRRRSVRQQTFFLP